MQKKKLFFSAAIIAAFLATMILVVIFNTGKVQAVSEVTSDSSYTLATDNLDLTMNVSSGTYIIVGSGTQRSNVSIDVVPTSASVTDVTIILDNVIIQTSNDASIISLNSGASGSTCNYTIIVKGNCRFESTKASSIYPLIQVQNVNASLVKLSESDLVAKYAKLSDLLTDSSVTYKTSLTIKDDGDGIEDILTLITAAGSYGAAIGAGEAELDIDVTLSSGKPSTTFSPYYYLDENGNNTGRHSAYDYLNDKYGTNYTDSTVLPLGKEFLIDTSVNAGNITIDGDLELNILGKGYGAGIGGGGSQSINVPGGSAGVVTLNNGTVTINMNSTAPCIGAGRNGAGGAAGNGNRIIVNGGSLYMNGVGSQYDGDIVNSESKKLYLFTVDLASKGGFSSNWTSTVDIEDDKYSNSYTANFDMNSSYATADVDATSFTYEGFGHKYASYAGVTSDISNKLYFYLPATPTSELTISGGSFISENQNIEVYQDETLIDPSNASSHIYTLSANKMVDIRVYDVPDTIEVSYIKIGTQNYPVSKITDVTGTYYASSFKMPETATSALVSYAGDISIEYDSGFVDTDSSNHGYVAPSVNIYSYGSSLVLSAPTATDLTFAGWYVTGTDSPVTSISTDDIIAGDIITDGVIKLTAKWNCTVTYNYYIEEGQSGIIRTDTYTYGAPYTLNPNDGALPTPPTINYYDFVGWNVNDTVYKPGESYTYYVNALTNNITVKAEYKKNRFYIYVDKEFFNATDTTLIVGANNIDFEQDEYNVDGKTYYRVLIEDAVNAVTLNIAAKQGYEISVMNWSVSVLNAASFTDSWTDNAVAYTLGLDNKDIYVKNNNSSFIPKQYTITFFDGVNDEAHWYQCTYTVEDFDLPAALTDILGSKAIEINSRYDRYHKFTGWKSNVAFGENAPLITQINALGNYIFIGTWEECSKYPLDITVYDSETNEISTDIGVVPYLYDEVYESKTPIPVTEVYDETTGENKKVIYVILEDNVYFEFVALNEDGTYMTESTSDYKIIDIGEGIQFANPLSDPYDYCVKYSYLSQTLEDTVKKIRTEKQYITVPKDVLDESPIQIDIRIKLSKFTIQYWDLRGYTHTNPVTYTIFDSFTFENVAEGIGWELVIQDTDDTNFDEVTTTPIYGVDKWSSGNMVVKPAWPEDYDGLYNITVELPDGSKGTVNIVYPTGLDKFTEQQTIFLNVSSMDGYKLVANSLVYTKVDNSPLKHSLLATYALTRDAIDMPVVILPLNDAEGMYLFMMPGSDIVINAEFEAEVYNISYNDIDDLVDNDNPISYTVEDEIILKNPTKEGYIFKGWLDGNGASITTISGIIGDIELTPVWNKIEEEITTPTIETPTNEGNNGNATPGNEEEITTPTIETPTNKGNNGNATPGNEEETTTKQQYIGGNSQSGSGSLQTNDNTNIVKLVLVCVCAAVLLLFAVIKKKDNSNKDEDGQIEDQK